MTISQYFILLVIVCAVAGGATGKIVEGSVQIPAQPIQVTIHSATPSGLQERAAHKVKVARGEGTVELGNGFLLAEISARTGVLLSIQNQLTGEKHVLIGDAVGVTMVTDSVKRPWLAAEGKNRAFQIQTKVADDGSDAQVTLDDAGVRIVYTLKAQDFWLERRLLIRPKSDHYTIDQIVYGTLNFSGGERRTLELGKFDRPIVITSSQGKGGLFAGVGHWFYRVADDGKYVNTDMAWDQSGEFESEPWYIGVFASEAGEPFAGWAWYKTYLQRIKTAMARHQTWFSWNAGWGQWGIDIDDPVAPAYLELMARLGINGVIFGSGGFGKGIGPFAELSQRDPTAKANVEALKRLGIAGGTLNNGARPWDDPKQQAPLLEELDRYASAGFGATAFDFFSTPDIYAAHRRVANYFRAAHDKLDYTECHLGMAVYGPQFQRWVRVNHPDDIHGFDISHFSSNWATFLAFRDSRRGWQKKYDYLMPEDGLYYFLTHYANWGNPRRYTDPEPQQFIWSVAAYCGIGFNFHDTFGWRDSIAAASAFTTAPVFGHIDLKMPPRDVEFARRFFAWMEENAATLRPARVCAENEAYCVLSKLTDGRGLIYVVNYQPGVRKFQLPLQTGHAGPLSIRQVYPSLETAQSLADGQTLSVRVRGESTAILEVNGALKSLPPENRSRFPIDLVLNQQKDSWQAQFEMPDVRDALAQAGDPALPRELLSLDQVQDSRPDLLVNIAADEKRSVPAVKWIGKGKLPQPFLNVYGFRDAQTVETWKIVPWAFADRVWLVVRPDKPIPLAGPHPTLTINGTAVQLMPRVDHRFDDIAKWNCPLYHADITAAVRFGAANELSINGAGEKPFASVTSAADRD